MNIYDEFFYTLTLNIGPVTCVKRNMFKESMYVRLQSVIHRPKSCMCIGINSPSLVHKLRILNGAKRYQKVETYGDEKKIQYNMFYLQYDTLVQTMIGEYLALSGTFMCLKYKEEWWWCGGYDWFNGSKERYEDTGKMILQN